MDIDIAKQRMVGGFQIPADLLPDTNKRVHKVNGFYPVTELLPKSSVLTPQVFFRVLVRMGFITTKDYQLTSKGGYTKYKVHRVLKEGRKYLVPNNKIIAAKGELFSELYEKVLDYVIDDCIKEQLINRGNHEN